MELIDDIVLFIYRFIPTYLYIEIQIDIDYTNYNIDYKIESHSSFNSVINKNTFDRI